MDLTRYAELFLTESREHLSAINQLLLELERDPGDVEPVVAIFRAAHTIKGMSATMGYTPVAELTHELETLLDAVRRGAAPVTPAVLDACFAAADALESAIDILAAGRGGEVDVSAVVTRLRGLSAGAAAPRVSAAPTAPPGVPPGEAAGSGMRVRVSLRADAPMRGVRALLVLKRAEGLGTVRQVMPPVAALQAEQFGRDITLLLETAAARDEVERALLAAGDVEGVAFDAAEREIGAPAPQPSPAAREAPIPRVVARHARIELRRLDALLNLIGELVISRGRLEQLARAHGEPALVETVEAASRLISELQGEIMASRMVPVSQVFDRFPRMVRDTARALGREVEFSVEGREIELDRSMLDEIGDPIVHLLRNAIDHGIETPDERRAAGKSSAGRLALSIARERSSVAVRVSDDGRGIDRARVLAKARAEGLADGAKTELTDDELVRLIARPGFSTADRVSDVSGRGVGMDAVQSRARALGGSVEVRTAPGKGTAVTLRLPVTLAIVRALLARVADETYAVPMTHVTETVALDGAHRTTVRGHEVLVLRDDVLPLLRLRERVLLPPSRGRAQAIVVGVGERRLGLVVDELAGQQDVVVKQFDGVRGGSAMFSGATILPDGAPALIVDVASLL